jgi:hypothetical protein
MASIPATGASDSSETTDISTAPQVSAIASIEPQVSAIASDASNQPSASQAASDRRRQETEMSFNVAECAVQRWIRSYLKCSDKKIFDVVAKQGEAVGARVGANKKVNYALELVCTDNKYKSKINNIISDDFVQKTVKFFKHSVETVYNTLIKAIGVEFRERLEKIELRYNNNGVFEAVPYPLLKQTHLISQYRLFQVQEKKRELVFKSRDQCNDEWERTGLDKSKNVSEWGEMKIKYVNILNTKLELINTMELAAIAEEKKARGPISTPEYLADLKKIEADLVGCKIIGIKVSNMTNHTKKHNSGTGITGRRGPSIYDN